MQAIEKKLLTVPEFAEALNNRIGRNSIYAAVRANRIRHIRPTPKKILILASEVENWLIRESNIAA